MVVIVILDHHVQIEETLDDCLRTIQDCHDDPRLKNLNALVLLMYKDRNKTGTLTTITDPSIYKKLIDRAEQLNVPLGYDSCSAFNYLRAIKDDEDFERKSQYVTSCCAARSSCYIDVEMNYHVCSFLEGREEWGEGISVLECDDFIKDIWNNERTIEFRNRNIACGEKQSNPCNYFN